MRPARALLAAILIFAAWPAAAAEIRFAPLFSDHAVLQRGKPVAVWGTASPAWKGTLVFGQASIPVQADSGGRWQAWLPAMPANPVPQRLFVPGSSASAEDVVVGDVWLCSGQSNMDFSLSGTDRPADIAAADFPGLRQFSVPLANRGEPADEVAGSWKSCSPATAGGFSAVAFHFGRAIHLDQARAVPIGLLVSSVGGTQIDPWLAPEGLPDAPSLAPLYTQPVLPFGPFSLFNGMIHPLAPYGIKGALWYQGENREGSSQGPDSYHLKMKALARGWARVFGMDELPFYFVQLANWGKPAVGPVPEASGGWADTRRQQAEALAIPHSGMAVAIDLGDAEDIHPKDKLDVGVRLARWALRNDYGRADLVPGGPVLRDAIIEGGRIVCAFDFAGSGLMVARKEAYSAAAETPGEPLKRFSIAGADGIWHEADARIEGLSVSLSSPAVPAPRKAAYAYWMNPAGCNLYNREGLPASPFLIEDAGKRHTLNATAGTGGSLSPSGIGSFRDGAAVLVRIAPDPGRFISGVEVDGRQVGAVTAFAFDPLHADHSISATFTATRPAYAIRVQASQGGTVKPSGTLTVPQGGSQAFAIAADPGCRAAVSSDGAPLGPRRSFAFADVRSDHVLDVAFTCPIQADAGFGGTLSPFGAVAVTAGGERAFTFTPLPGYAVARVLVDGRELGSRAGYAFSGVRGPHTLSVSFSGGKGRQGSVPRRDRLLFSVMGSDLPASGPIPGWLEGEGRNLVPIGSPTVEVVDGRRYARNDFLEGDGHALGAYGEPLHCEGATLVAVARPVRNGAATPWNAVVNVFHDRLSLGIRNDSGRLCVLRDGAQLESREALPDGVITILSLVVKPDGSSRAWANGALILDEPGGKPFAALTPGVAGPFASRITLGRNAADAWSAFNGDIGDVYAYTVALDNTEREELEAFIERGLIGGNAPLAARPGSRAPIPAIPANTKKGRRVDANGRKLLRTDSPGSFRR